MEAVKEEKAEDSGRKHQWLTLQEAINTVSPEKSKDVLRLAGES